jgi:hypothetical protein
MKNRGIFLNLIALMWALFYAFVPAAIGQTQIPFSASIHADMESGEVEESAVFFKVPSNKRLTIQFVSVRAAVPVKQEVLFTLVADNPDYVPLIFQGVFNLEEGAQSLFGANQAVTVFAGPGREVSGVFRRSKSMGQTGDLAATIFGTLQDAP